MLRSSTFRMLLCISMVLLAVPLFGQQTGTISGKVTSTDGAALPGVTVEARSTVLPQPRTTVTESNGEFRLPALQVGTYTVDFSLAGLQNQTRKVEVLLNQTAQVNVSLGMAAASESITVTAASTLVDTKSAEIKSALADEQIRQVPVGQDYRDLVKLAPAVQVSQDSVRGPSAGGSGQDNMYNFDGVNVTLPLFGTLSSEPASHDIAQITVVKGGAKAIDFNRAGGFLIDSVSKSGTSEYHGEVSYQVQTDSMTSEVTKQVVARHEQDKTWGTLNVGGPILKDRLFFYGSYYRPTISEGGSTNAYGPTPDYKSTRNEGFLKLTATPLSTILLNGSYRDSKRDETAASVGQFEAGTASAGNEATLKIGTFEGSWVATNNSLVTAKWTNFVNNTQGRPDNLASANVNTALGTHLDIANLETQGYFSVPSPVSGNTSFNNFIAPLISRYGYVKNDVRTGGGAVGNYFQFDNDDFRRHSAQVGYDLTLGSKITHDLHAGYQWYTDAEDLLRTSNGWGTITVPGGRTSFGGKPIYYQADFQQQTLGTVAPIHSEYKARNLELNDVIRFKEWSFNVGVLTSQDRLYGQGLKEDSSALSGYVASPGTKYKMYEMNWGKMLQPRVGATWNYNGQDNVFASYAVYKPAASSLPRAASWARNLARTIRAYFDENGNLFGVDPVASSSGKLFVDDLDPRTTQEYMIGTSQQFTSRWTGRAYGRYRYTNHFWEDTNNNARIAFNAPGDIPHELYIPDLTQRLAQIGSGSTYVIAELDGAFTKYYEATFESEWRGGKTFFRGSYTWSHYYGNFDQDNTTLANDANSFIGSSFIGDGAGRQLWNFRYGDLRGDRRNLLKLYGSYDLPWNASAGVFSFYQSGQPWEIWSYEPYISLTNNTSDTARYAEPAGRRRTPSHYQVDLNYTQNLAFAKGNIQLVADLYNLFDRQTGYNVDPTLHSTTFGQYRSFWAPRRLQLAVRYLF